MRDIFNDLVFLGRIEKEVKLFGKKWTLSTLTAEQQVEATAATSDLEAIARVNALKIQILSKSLKKINDIEFIDEREALEVVSGLQLPVVNALFTEYESVQREQDEKLKDLDELKN
jgi:hypothetical protein